MGGLQVSTDSYSNVGHDAPETQADAEHDLDILMGELITMKPRLFLWQDFTAESTQTDVLWLPLDGVTSVSLFGDTLEVNTARREFQTDDQATIARFFEQWEVV